MPGGGSGGGGGGDGGLPRALRVLPADAVVHCWGVLRAHFGAVGWQVLAVGTARGGGDGGGGGGHVAGRAGVEGTGCCVVGSVASDGGGGAGGGCTAHSADVVVDADADADAGHVEGGGIGDRGGVRGDGGDGDVDGFQQILTSLHTAGGPSGGVHNAEAA